MPRRILLRGMKNIKKEIPKNLFMPMAGLEPARLLTA